MKRSHLGPAAHGLMALAVVSLVLALAYPTQAPALGVAEFAPVANADLDQPPPTDRSHDGSGAGRRERAGRTAATTTTATPSPSGEPSAPTTLVGRSRTCVGEPPRQIPDPMSPPCVATIFEGDNGGSTHRGVSSTEIRIGVPALDLVGLTSPYRKSVDLLFDYFNATFELYGRRMVPVYTKGSVYDAVGSRAMAADIVSQDVFAVLTGIQEFQYNPQIALVSELARAGVVTIVKNASTWWTDATLFDEHHPYVWSSYPSAEDFQRNLADFACTSLAGRAAFHAGDSTLQQKQRRFGVVSVGSQTSPSTSVLTSALADCTGQAPLTARWDRRSSSTTTLRTAFERMKADGATTVLCVCDKGMVETVGSAAMGAAFGPEWILPPMFTFNDHDEVFREHRTYFGSSGVMRLSAGPRMLPLAARPVFTAIASAGPGFMEADEFNTYSVLGISDPIYDQFLILASGLQAAGPILSPESFAQGLMGLPFPNPGAGQAPFWQPSIGFGPGDHALYDDYHVGWWSDEAPTLDVMAKYYDRGSWCFLQQGSRYSLGRYPRNADALLFDRNRPCR